MVNRPAVTVSECLCAGAVHGDLWLSGVHYEDWRDNHSAQVSNTRKHMIYTWADPAPWVSRVRWFKTELFKLESVEKTTDEQNKKKCKINRLKKD